MKLGDKMNGDSTMCGYVQVLVRLGANFRIAFSKSLKNGLFGYLYNLINKRYLKMSDSYLPFTIIRNFRKQESHQYKKQLCNAKNSWTIIEHKNYIRFFNDHSYFAHDKDLRKAKKMFKMMSAYIHTRNHIQIKSHHQKLMVKYGSLDNVIAQLQTAVRANEPLRMSDSVGTELEKQYFSAKNLEGQQERSQERSQQTTHQASFQLSLFDILNWPDHSIPENDDYLQE